MLSGEADHTSTRVQLQGHLRAWRGRVCASSPVLARCAGTLAGVEFTLHTFPAWLTRASKRINPIVAVSVVGTRVAGAIILVFCTVMADESGRARARVAIECEVVATEGSRLRAHAAI